MTNAADTFFANITTDASAAWVLPHGSRHRRVSDLYIQP
jgi:hypothetical protein